MFHVSIIAPYVTMVDFGILIGGMHTDVIVKTISPFRIIDPTRSET